MIEEEQKTEQGKKYKKIQKKNTTNLKKWILEKLKGRRMGGQQ